MDATNKLQFLEIRPSLCTRLHHVPSNINPPRPRPPPPFPWLMHSVPSLSRLAYFLLYFAHLVVMTKLWLDSRMCRAFICLVRCLILPPPPTPPTPLEPQPPKHTRHNSHLPRLARYWRAEWLLGSHGNNACVCVCVCLCFSTNVSPSLRLSWTWTHTKTQVRLKKNVSHSTTFSTAVFSIRRWTEKLPSEATTVQPVGFQCFKSRCACLWSFLLFTLALKRVLHVRFQFRRWETKSTILLKKLNLKFVWSRDVSVVWVGHNKCIYFCFIFIKNSYPCGGNVVKRLFIWKIST